VKFEHGNVIVAEMLNEIAHINGSVQAYLIARVEMIVLESFGPVQLDHRSESEAVRKVKRKLEFASRRQLLRKSVAKIFDRSFCCVKD
jgi:hypothetical protein